MDNGILPCWQEAMWMGGGSVRQRMGGYVLNSHALPGSVCLK